MDEDTQNSFLMKMAFWFTLVFHFELEFFLEFVSQLTQVGRAL